MWDRLWINITLANPSQDQECNLTEQAAIACKDGKIAWLGSMTELKTLDLPEELEVIDGNHKFLTPALIDCHTHLIYAGQRATEYQQRLAGQSYETISKAGGGIQSTVANTINTSDEVLYAVSKTRLQSMLSQGVASLEIKSGYGLDLANELRILRIAKQLAEHTGMSISKTLLSAHVVPPAYKATPDKYIDYIVEEIIPAAVNEQLVDAVDVFCDEIAFSPAQCEKIFLAAKQYDLAVKCHADQFSRRGGSSLAASFGACSCDHLEFIEESDIIELQAAGTVAVLLPIAHYYLKMEKIPPIDLFRKHQCHLAIATDANPGTAPSTSILLACHMACHRFGLSFAEAFNGISLNAAKALNMASERGHLAPGLAADFAIWDIEDINELAYYVGYNPCQEVIKAGETIYQRAEIS